MLTTGSPDPTVPNSTPNSWSPRYRGFVPGRSSRLCLPSHRQIGRQTRTAATREERAAWQGAQMGWEGRVGDYVGEQRTVSDPFQCLPSLRDWSRC